MTALLLFLPGDGQNSARMWYYSLERIFIHEKGRNRRLSRLQRGGIDPHPAHATHTWKPVLMDHREDPGGAARHSPRRNRRRASPVPPKPYARSSLPSSSWPRRRKSPWNWRPSCLPPAPASSISAAPSACARPRTTPPGTRRPTPSPNCWPRPSTACPNSAATASPPRAWSRIPGCYPTAANLAIRPLLEAGVIDRAAGIVCDAKSGVSGAGRKPSLKTSFCEVTENFSAYSILHHRHVPEVLPDLRPRRARVQLHRATPAARPRHPRDHLLPRRRHCQRRRPARHLRTPYAGEPFVRLFNPPHMPDLRGVARTNFCDIGVTFDAAHRARRRGQRHR